MEVKPLLTILGFRESEIREHNIWIREVGSPKFLKHGKFHGGTRVGDLSKFFHFGRSEGKRSNLLSQKYRSCETVRESQSSVRRRTSGRDLGILQT
jgi:hypothetical protein